MTALGDAPPLAWERLLEAGEIDERLVLTSAEEARAAAIRGPTDGPGSGARRGARASGNRAPLLASARRAGRRADRRRDRHQRHRVGQVAVVQPPGPRRDRPRSEGTRALRLSHQGARPGPGAQALRARAVAPPARDLRRRHPARRSAGDPPALEPRAHQPRHAQHGGARPSQGLGRLPRQPRVDRRRRGTYLQGRVRLARGERPATAAPRGPCLRLRAAVRARLGDDRQSGRARRRPHRNRVRARRLRRGPAGAPADRDLEPARDRPQDDAAPLGAQRGRRAARGPDHQRRPHDLLPEEPARDRADPAVHPDAPRGPRRAAPRRPHRPVPRGLHAAAAPRDRGPARRRGAACGGRDGCARARHRHRRARRGDLRHLPGHRCQPASDVGAGGAPQRRDRPLRRGRGRARPVLLPPSGGVPRPTGRGGDPRPHQRADPDRARARRRLRGAARRARRPAGRRRRRDPRAALA